MFVERFLWDVEGRYWQSSGNLITVDGNLPENIDGENNAHFP